MFAQNLVGLLLAVLIAPGTDTRLPDAAMRGDRTSVQALLKLNADIAPSVSSRLGISGIPTLLLMSNGQLISRTSGGMDAKSIVAWAEPAPMILTCRERKAS